MYNHLDTAEVPLFSREPWPRLQRCWSRSRLCSTRLHERQTWSMRLWSPGLALLSSASAHQGVTGLLHLNHIAVRNGFGVVFVSCWLSLLLDSFLAHNHSELSPTWSSERRGSLYVRENAVVVCRCQRNARVSHSRWDSGWHFFQKIAPELTCHVCYTWITHHSSCLLSDGSTNCWATHWLYSIQRRRDLIWWVLLRKDANIVISNRKRPTLSCFV